MRRLAFLFACFLSFTASFGATAPVTATSQAITTSTPCLYSATDPAGQFRMDLTTGATHRCASTGFYVAWDLPPCPASPTTADCTDQAVCKDADAAALYLCSHATLKYVIVSGGGGGSLATLSDVSLTDPAEGNVLVKGPSGWVNAQVQLNNSASVSGVLANVSTTATAANATNSIVARDATGTFNATMMYGDVTGSLIGNATSATTSITAASALNALAGDNAAAFFNSGILEVARGGTGTTPPLDDMVMVSTPARSAVWTSLPGTCTGPIGYSAATNLFTCPAAASGTVTVTGTPAAQQMAVWNSASELKGNSSVTVDMAGVIKATGFDSPPSSAEGGSLTLYSATGGNEKTWKLNLGTWDGATDFVCDITAAGLIESSCLEAGVATSLTTRGDIQGFDTSNARIPVGTAGQILSTVNPSSGVGVGWVTPVTTICGSIAIDPGPINPVTTGVGTSGTVTGLAAGDVCVCHPTTVFNDDLVTETCYGSTNALNIRLYNPTAGSLDGTSQTVKYCCFR